MANDTIFFSYSRDDSNFVMQLAKDLRQAGATIWLDTLDIQPGTHWDSSIEKALRESSTLLVILSNTSVKSTNVMDEVSFALDENKKVVPVLLENCAVPFRLKRLQYADFSGDRETGLKNLVEALQLEKEVATKLVKTEQIHQKETYVRNQQNNEKPHFHREQPVYSPNKTGTSIPVKKTNYTPYYIVGGCLVMIIIVIILLAFLGYAMTGQEDYYDY